MLVDFGTVEGIPPHNKKTHLRDEQIIQTPEMFGFNNARREVLPDEIPATGVIPSTYIDVASAVHEFVHDMDQYLSNSSMERGYKRSAYRSSDFLVLYRSSSGTPAFRRRSRISIRGASPASLS